MSEWKHSDEKAEVGQMLNNTQPYRLMSHGRGCRLAHCHEFTSALFALRWTYEAVPL